MTLRRKIVWSLLILAGVGIMLEGLLYRFILLPSYESLERDDIRQEAERGKAALEGELQHLRVFASDWGTWDDMYRFVKDQNPEFIKANFELPAFTKSGLNLIGVYDRSGHRIWFGAHGRDSGISMELPEFPTAGLPADHPLLRLETVDSSVAGLLRTAKGAMLIASVPIVTSKNKGPINGVIVMGQLLDAAYEQKLRDQTRTDMRLLLLPPGATNRPGLFQFEPRADVLRVNTTVADLAGQPLLAIETAMPRHIMARGRAATRLAVISSAIAAILLLLALAWLMQRLVVAPLGRIQRHATIIRESADLSHRLAAGGTDEIGLLSREFDLLLDHIQTMTRELDARVKTRTADLEAANVSLRESRRAALNLMQDAVAARRQAEHAEAALRESEQRIQQALRVSRSFTFEWTLATDRVLRSASCETILSLTGDEARNDTGQRYFQRVHPDDRARFVQMLGELTPATNSYTTEYRVVRGDADVVVLEEIAQGIFDAANKLQRLVGVSTDITERKQAEQRLAASLQEKEVLLKEIHHRVKNNMQVISSLVSLQADSLANPVLRGVFQDVRDRVRSMALVHENLYKSASLDRVDFADYTRGLLRHLWHGQKDAAGFIRLALDLQPVTLSVEHAVPCGLILNELATNALKHAFKGRAEGEVRVALGLEPDGCVCLCVSDNGVGLPTGLDWRESSTLGMKLVQMLTSQLNGTMDVHSSAGTEFRLTFSESKKQIAEW